MIHPPRARYGSHGCKPPTHRLRYGCAPPRPCGWVGFFALPFDFSVISQWWPLRGDAAGKDHTLAGGVSAHISSTAAFVEVM